MRRWTCYYVFSQAFFNARQVWSNPLMSPNHICRGSKLVCFLIVLQRTVSTHNRELHSLSAETHLEGHNYQ